MGQSATAGIGWGIDLGGKDDGYHESIERLAERDGLGRLLDQERPPWPVLPAGLTRREQEMHPASREHAAKVADWERRRDITVPLTADFYGYIDYAGWVLVTKNSYHDVEWGCDPLDTAKLIRHVPGSDDEWLALNKVLDSIGYRGARNFSLLLWTSYG